MSIAKRYRYFVRRLIGHHSVFTLENRMFNMICIIAFAALLPSLIVNRFFGVPDFVTFIVAALLVALGYLYYVSRFKKRFNISRIIFAICSYGFLSLNYFYNSGIYGPTILAFFLTYIFLIAIFPRKTYALWTLLHFAVAMALIFVSYNYPDIAPNMYTSDLERSIDVCITYTLMLVFSYFALDFIRANYDFEKRSASNRAIAIENHNHELAKVNEEKNKLFSIVSHDLRSPLNTIHSYLELLSFGVLDDKEKEEAQGELLSLTKNTSDLLSNLLSWSKAQMEGVQVTIQKHNLGEILTPTINTQRAIAAKKNIGFNNQIDKQAMAMCDTDMLQLVVRNLLNNAIKFTPAQGEIILSTKQEGNTIQLLISDNGLGIPKEQQGEIFSLKIRSTYGTHNEKGIGLGLILCKNYMDMQSGKIWFDSEPGKGTTFYLSLPC